MGCNGEVAVVEPPGKQTRYGAVEHLSFLLQMIEAGLIKSVLFVIDQEDEALYDVYSRLEEALKSHGFAVDEYKEYCKGRLRAYEVERDGYGKIRLIACVNGLDEVSSARHSIEDHLMLALELTGENGKTSKELLDKALGKDRKIEDQAFRKIMGDPERFCPQQIQALKLLLGLAEGNC